MNKISLYYICRFITFFLGGISLIFLYFALSVTSSNEEILSWFLVALSVLMFFAYRLTRKGFSTKSVVIITALFLLFSFLLSVSLELQHRRLSGHSVSNVILFFTASTYITQSFLFLRYEGQKYFLILLVTGLVLLSIPEDLVRSIYPRGFSANVWQELPVVTWKILPVLFFLSVPWGIVIGLTNQKHKMASD